MPKQVKSVATCCVCQYIVSCVFACSCIDVVMLIIQMTVQAASQAVSALSLKLNFVDSFQVILVGCNIHFVSSSIWLLIYDPKQHQAPVFVFSS